MNDQPQEHFAKHGGVHFQSNRPPEDINDFVKQLPAEKRDSLYEVLQELNQAGFITLFNDELWTAKVRSAEVMIVKGCATNL